MRLIKTSILLSFPKVKLVFCIASLDIDGNISFKILFLVILCMLMNNNNNNDKNHSNIPLNKTRPIQRGCFQCPASEKSVHFPALHTWSDLLLQELQRCTCTCCIETLPLVCMHSCYYSAIDRLDPDSDSSFEAQRQHETLVIIAHSHHLSHRLLLTAARAPAAFNSPSPAITSPTTQADALSIPGDSHTHTHKQPFFTAHLFGSNQENCISERRLS